MQTQRAERPKRSATARATGATPRGSGSTARSSGAASRTIDTPLGRLELILNDAGIAEDRFARAAETAVAELRRGAGPDVDDPVTQVSDAERRYLEAGGLDLTPRRKRDPDPRAEFVARYAALLADSEDVGEVADRLGVTRARVRQRALDRSLLAIREDDEWRFPRFQFADPNARPQDARGATNAGGAANASGAPVRGLPAVSIAMPTDLHPVAVSRFLTDPHGDLELEGRPVSPLDWLRSGGSPDPVVAIAREL